MVSGALFIGAVIMLEAGPVYNLFMAGLQQRPLSAWEWIWIVGSFCLVLLVCVLALILPMRFGEKRLSRLAG